ncbi:MAG: phosphoribosylanthranilate isomerase [Psychroserpens sp.]|uniref:phosphoribosylanthranilate isomerase n=1 Tax=Psychroserpens sp. TaxID=2020870 RepID=UPI00300144F6
MKLKICGMKYKDNISEVAELQPDYLGFIFYEKSSRFFEGNIPDLPESIKKVGVFVDASLEFVTEKIQAHNLQAVQLHGKESPEFCETLRQVYHSALDAESIKNNEVSASAGVTDIIKVFSIKDDFDFSVIKPFENVCDYFLFDTKGKLSGGNGYTFNWDVLKNYTSTKPFFLSGGIGLDEVEKLKAFKNTNASKYCYVIDVNSKFEIKPGLKNSIELETFKNELQH